MPFSIVNSFDNNVNIYKWDSIWKYETAFENGGYIGIDESYRSSMLRANQGQRMWKDDQQFNFNLNVPITPGLAGKVIASSVSFADRISGIKNDILTNFGSLGFQTQYIPNCNITTLMGYKFDNRLDQHDQGMTYLVDFMMPRVDWNEYANQVRLYLNGDQFAVRENSDMQVHYAVNKTFYSDTSDSLSIQWKKKRRDNYDRWDGSNTNVESLNENVLTISNNLTYRLTKKLLLVTQSEINSKQTAVNRLGTKDRRAKTDFSSMNEFRLLLNTSHIQNNFKLTYETNNLRNETPDSLRSLPFSSRIAYVSPDYKSTRLAMGMDTDISFGKFDTLTTRHHASIYRYDTPERTNFDDRDELRIDNTWIFSHRFTPRLKLKLNGSVNLKHLVFIFGQRSADNNWMRIIRLYPEIHYVINRRTRIFQAFEVLANYVDYDFEERALSPSDIRSYVYRKFMTHHILTFSITRRTSATINYKLELEENGKLFWDDWTEMIISTRQNHYAKALLTYEIISHANISVGALFYKRSENFNFSSNSNSISALGLNDYISYGPTINLQYMPHERIHVLFSGSRRAIDQVNRDRYYINNINLEVGWYL
ncbi:hypothetical protein JW960_10285 [candidate division KSB1 bacterium]|nr:hypothetical protein [candidate division KSB1 bacterium]